MLKIVNLKIVNIFEVLEDPFRKVQVKKNVTALKQTFQPLKIQNGITSLIGALSSLLFIYHSISRN